MSKLFKVVVGYETDITGVSTKHRVNQYIWESDALGTTVEHKAVANVEEDHPGCAVWIEEDAVEVAPWGKAGRS